LNYALIKEVTDVFSVLKNEPLFFDSLKYPESLIKERAEDLAKYTYNSRLGTKRPISMAGARELADKSTRAEATLATMLNETGIFTRWMSELSTYRGPYDLLVLQPTGVPLYIDVKCGDRNSTVSVTHSEYVATIVEGGSHPDVFHIRSDWYSQAGRNGIVPTHFYLARAQKWHESNDNRADKEQYKYTYYAKQRDICQFSPPLSQMQTVPLAHMLVQM
jgi:hypothetical protein